MNTGLEFAPGTTDECQKLVVGMFEPTALLSAYRTARRQHQTGDIVLVSPSLDPSELYAGTRAEYAKHLRQVFGARAGKFGMLHKSAHGVAQLPAEADAMWLVVNVPGQDMPAMCVLFALAYEQSEQAN